MLIHDHILSSRQFASLYVPQHMTFNNRGRHRMRKLSKLFMTTTRRKRLLHEYNSLKECRMRFRYV